MPEADGTTPTVPVVLEHASGADDPREAQSLAVLLAAAYAQMVADWAKQQNVPPAEAAAQLARLPAADQLDVHGRAVTSWSLARLVEHDPAAAAAVWERVKADARDELETGHRAADAVDYDGDVWQRAQFLALRAAFREDWQPRGGTEAALLDAIAQSYTAYLAWTTRATMTSYHDAKRQDASLKAHGYYEPPRLTEAEVIDRTAAMADRWHRMFLRNVRALRDLRRYVPPAVVNVQSVGQLNVGAQQVNVQAERDRSD
jgi:hypothetical protein